MSQEQRQPTMADVALRAGVSVSTVSRTLRGLPSVAPPTRDRVERAAREMSFAVSRSASSLASGRTRRVAVLTPGLHSWFLATALSGVAAVLHASDLDLLVYSVIDPRERAEFFDRLPARRNADALLVISLALTARERERLDELGMPVVFAGRPVPGRAGVYADDAEGARSGTRHLVNLGHRRIAYLGRDDGTGFGVNARDRLTGYRQALDEAGLPYEESLVSGAGGVREALCGLLALPDVPTAVFAECDQLAMEAVAVLRSYGLDVPGRTSVLGFDDHELAGALDLTTVSQPAHRIGRVAAELASSMVDDPGRCPSRQHIVLPTRLILRGTTAPPPARR
ncbi:LacI family DNA-binding transcriptional regulator [Streptomyces sp.]|uniref:LacI family DNA-binding transcriptional regulator n=1 Tax=Streptomyces sp. TaxID=1931 RepID=UPI002F3E3D3A